MKKNLLLLLLLIFISLFIGLKAFADTYSNDVSLIEQELFNATFANNSIQKRLSTIEKDLYGTDFPKLSTNKRIEKIKKDFGYSSFEEQTQLQTDTFAQERTRKDKELQEADYPSVDRLESVVFNNIYNSENIYKRLDRLEQKLFGATNQTSTLSDRVSALNKMVIKDDGDTFTSTRTKTHTYTSKRPKQDIQLGKYSSNRNYDFEVAVMEQQILGQTYKYDDISTRLSRLEEELLKNNYSSEDTISRLERLSTVILAQKTAPNYETNKFKQFFSTGMQVGSLILLLLATIL